MRLPILLFLLQLIALNNAFKILYLVPFPAPSHWFWLKNFSEELLKRGHDVTAITNYKRPESHPNYTEIIISAPYNVVADFPADEFFSMKYDSVLENLYLTWNVGLRSTEHAFRDKNVAAFINRTDLQFDIVILEQFFHDSWLPFAKKFNAPLLTIATLGHADYFDSATGLLTPSYVPHHVLTYTDNMNFYERCVNLFWRLTDAFLRKYYYMAQMQEMADRYFGDAFNGTVPSIRELEKNISFRIINTHQSMQHARPKMPGLTYVAGIHIKQPKPLPADVQEFLDNGSEHGVIYFSFGSCIRSADLPPGKLRAFIETFRLMKQKVLWKFEDETIPNMPQNVMIRKWLPQSDVLAHKNIVLFLTHGGIFGTQESIHWAVPMVFIPIYSDQFRNARRCVDAGLAEMLSFHEISVKNLHEKMNTVLKDTKYANQVQLVSQQFRDNLADPMEESMYWIEFIARHKHNYPIFKPNAPNVPWYTCLYLDILLVIVVSFYITISLTKYALKKVWQRYDHNRSFKEKVQ